MGSNRDLGRNELREEERYAIADFLDGIPALAESAGFSPRVYGEIDGHPLLCLTREIDRPEVLYLSAGIHGDEPAGPKAIEQLLRERALREEVGWVVFPLLNPGGLRRGSRENPEGIDLNRDYQVQRAAETRAHRALLEAEDWSLAASLALHEDWEARGPYLYEHNPDRQPHPCRLLLETLGAHGPVEDGPEIDGWPTAGPGLIHPPSEIELRTEWPEQLFLLSRFTRMSYTLETPSALPFLRRVACAADCVRSFACLHRWESPPAA